MRARLSVLWRAVALNYVYGDEFSEAVFRSSQNQAGQIQVLTNRKMNILKSCTIVSAPEHAKLPMCKHCKDEKDVTIHCRCKCADSDWQDSEPQSTLIQQDVAWIKCIECKHYLFFKAVSPKVIVERGEMKRHEAPFFQEQRPHMGPEPVPRLWPEAFIF
jgi:hypothetical protein